MGGDGEEVKPLKRKLENPFAGLPTNPFFMSKEEKAAHLEKKKLEQLRQERLKSRETAIQLSHGGLVWGSGGMGMV